MVMSPEQWMVSQKPETPPVPSPEQWMAQQKPVPSPEEWMKQQGQVPAEAPLAPQADTQVASNQPTEPFEAKVVGTILEKKQDLKNLYTDFLDLFGSAPAYLGAGAAGLAAAGVHAATGGEGTAFGAASSVADAIMQQLGSPAAKLLGRGQQPSAISEGMGVIGSGIDKVSDAIGEKVGGEGVKDATKFTLTYIAPLAFGGRVATHIKNMKFKPPVAEQLDSSSYVQSWHEQLRAQPADALSSAAFKDTETGQIITSGPRHDDAMKAETLGGKPEGDVVHQGETNELVNQYRKAANARGAAEQAARDASNTPRAGEAFAKLRTAIEESEAALDKLDKHEPGWKEKYLEIPKPGTKVPKDLVFYNGVLPKYEQGFVDNAGRFLDRQESLSRAKETGQFSREKPILPDQGLHSTDMREEGAPDFQEEKIDTSPANVKDAVDFNMKGLQILKTMGPEEADKFARSVVAFNRNHLQLETPKTNDELVDTFYRLGKNKEADTSEAVQRLQEAESAGVTLDMKIKWRKYAESGEPLDEQSTALFNKYYAPEAAERADLINLIRDKGWVKELPEEMDESVTGSNIARMMIPKQESFLDRIKSKLSKGDQGGFNVNIERRRGAVMERSLFAGTKGGERVVLQVDGNRVVAWRDGKPEEFGRSEYGLKPGDQMNGYNIKEATVDELHQHTPYRYNQDSLTVLHKRLNELRDFVRSRQMIESLKSSPYFKEVAHSPFAKGVPEGFRTPQHLDKIPALRGWTFEPKVAEIIEDFAKNYQPNTLNLIGTALIKNMMLNPLPHMGNEGWHLYNARGLSGWVTPAGIVRFAKTGMPAAKEVITQGPQFREMLRQGGSLLSASTRNDPFFTGLLNKGAEEFVNTPEGIDLAKSIGMKPLELYDAMSKASSKAMWVARDTMYVQLVNETMMTKKMNMQDAMKEVERHMPSYRLPTRVMGSRKLSEALQNPNVSVFSRYHYGMVKSLVETAKDLTGKNVKSGVDTAAAIAVALSVLYPLQDMLAQQLTGNQEAKTRRAGPYHPISTIMETARGEKQPYPVLSSVFTFNPALLAGAQLLADRQLFNGQPIYNPMDDPSLIAKDVGRYLATQVPQVQTSLQVSGERGGGFNQWAAKQLDIQSPSMKQVQMQQQMRRKELDKARRRHAKENP